MTAELNPWDRALYLSVKELRPFFHLQNWANPFQGLTNTPVQRAATSGCYFPLEHLGREALEDWGVWAHQPTSQAWAAGCFAGAVNGLAFNWIAAVKYTSWGRPNNQRSTFQTARSMWHDGGLRPFCRGIGPTVARDVVFGGCFAAARASLLAYTDGQHGVLCNFAAAAAATVGSSPLNYARNTQFATPKGTRTRPTVRILASLCTETFGTKGRAELGPGAAEAACGKRGGGGGSGGGDGGRGGVQ
eukprot:COSAG05_NODE_3229_length_2222_cov_3.090438_4_plen_246_part_00